MRVTSPTSLRREPVQVTGAATLWVVGQVTGPRRQARVLHTGPDAAYLDLAGVCIGVLSAGAVLVPCGIRTAMPALPDLEPGSTAVVVGGAVELTASDGTSLDVSVTGLVDATVPVLPDPPAGETLDDLLAGRLDDVRAQLPAEALDRLAAGDPDAALALLGLGPGLTPLGDDVLAGWLATAQARRLPALAPMRDAVAAAAPTRTTTLSGTLLGCAGRGEVVPDHRALLLALARGDSAAAGLALDALLTIGATSGAGLALGTALALGAAMTLARASATPTHEGAAG